MQFMHLGTCVTVHDDLHLRTAGQTVWGNVLSDGRAGVAWHMRGRSRRLPFPAKAFWAIVVN